MILAVTTTLTACTDPSYHWPPAPTTLDYGPHDAFLGAGSVTISGPGADYGVVGAQIYDNEVRSGASYGQVTAPRTVKITLPATPPANSRTGPIDQLIPKELPIFFPMNSCSLNTIQASSDATYFVPNFATATPQSGAVLFGDPGPPTMPVFPAKLAEGKLGYLLTGRLVYVNQDVTLTGGATCNYFNPTLTLHLKVNVTMKAGWNVLREQDISERPKNQPEVSRTAITGGAADYQVTSR